MVDKWYLIGENGKMDTKKKIRVVEEIKWVCYEEVQKEKARREEECRKFLKNLRTVECHNPILTNKPQFLRERRCPHCNHLTKKETVKIKRGTNQKYLVTDLWHCKQCNVDYIDLEQMNILDNKAKEELGKSVRCPIISPQNTSIERSYEGKTLFIPQYALNSRKYNKNNLPPRINEYYDMSEGEYDWVKSYFATDMFSGRLKTQSFLGAAGYFTYVSEVRRHQILKECAEEYGKNKVIKQITSNMNLKLNQVNGSVKYAKAIRIWRDDLSYVCKL